MRINKSLALGWGVAFALAVAGCSDKSASPTDKSTAAPAAPATTQATPAAPAPAQTAAPEEAADETLTIDLAKVQKPWTGDLDGMIERRIIRVLTVNSKTIYFLDKGVLRGTAVDYGRLFEEDLNKKLKAEKKLKNKNLKVRLIFIPLRRDELLPRWSRARATSSPPISR